MIVKPENMDFSNKNIIMIISGVAWSRQNYAVPIRTGCGSGRC